MEVKHRFALGEIGVPLSRSRKVSAYPLQLVEPPQRPHGFRQPTLAEKEHYKNIHLLAAARAFKD